MSAAPQVEDQKVYVLVNWSHVSNEDRQILNTAINQMISNNAHIAAFARTIGTEMVAEAFQKALNHHYPNSQTMTTEITAQQVPVFDHPAATAEPLAEPSTPSGGMRALAIQTPNAAPSTTAAPTTTANIASGQGASSPAPRGFKPTFAKIVKTPKKKSRRDR